MSLIRSLRALLAETVGAMQTRVTLFGLEWEQARADLLRQGILMFIGFALVFMALLLATFFVVLLVWETPYRHWAVLLLAVLYAVIGGASLWRVRRSLSDPDAQPFAATLAELSRDAKYLDSVAQGQTEPETEQEQDVETIQSPVSSMSVKDGQL